MKRFQRIFTLMLALMLLPALLLTVNASTQSKYDSVTIEPEVLEMLGVSETDTVIRVYAVRWLQLAKDGTLLQYIQEIGETPTLAPFLIFSENQKPQFVQIKDGIPQEIKVLYGIPTMYQNIEKISERAFNCVPELWFYPKIQNVYCIYGTEDYEPCAVYFSTAQGDYIYFKAFDAAQREYIFPEGVFAASCDQIVSKTYAIAVADYTGKEYIGDHVFDLSPYEINEENRVHNFHPDAPPWGWIIGAAALIVVAALVTLAVLKKKNRSLPEQNEPPTEE